MSEYYNNILTDDVKNAVIKEYLDEQKYINEKIKIFKDYNNYIASYEYSLSMNIESICEDVDAYDKAGGDYYELILFYFHDFLSSFNYKKYIYLRFYNNIRSDVYYSNNTNGNIEINIDNLVSVINDVNNESIFNKNYKTGELHSLFIDIITTRINDTFTLYNYYRNNIKHPYKYKSNINNYLIKDFVYDYTSLLDKHIILSPCEYDGVFLNNVSIYNNITTDTPIIDGINNIIYGIDFDTFIDFSFIIKYYSEYFSRDGVKSLNTFYSDKIHVLVIPELYKLFLSNIKKSKNINDLYEKRKYVYNINIEDEICNINKDLCPNISGLIFICKCNYVYKLWQLIFNNNIFYYRNYPDKKIIAIINENIISNKK